jgi:hypothetical protein
MSKSKKRLAGGSVVLRTYTHRQRRDVPEGCIKVKLSFILDTGVEVTDWFMLPLGEYRKLREWKQENVEN